MASILNRYENIMSTNVCGMIEFAEDPMKMARHLSHHMEDDLSKTKREGAELIAEIEKLEDNKSVPNAEALLVAKKAELMKLHEIHEKLNDQIQQQIQTSLSATYTQATYTELSKHKVHVKENLHKAVSSLSAHTHLPQTLKLFQQLWRLFLR